MSGYIHGSNRVFSENSKVVSVPIAQTFEVSGAKLSPEK